METSSATALHNRQTLLILLGAAGVFLAALCVLIAGFIWWYNQQRALEMAKNSTQTAISEIRTATSQFILDQNRTATQNALATQQARATQEMGATLDARATQEAHATQEMIATLDARATQVAHITQEAQALAELHDEITRWKPVVLDNFDVVTDTWWVGDDDNEWLHGTWSIEDSQYQVTLEALKGFSTWVYPDELGNVADFYLAVDLSFIEAPDTMGGGLVFRVQENNDEYYLFEVTAGGNYGVYQSTSGEWDTIIAETPTENFYRYDPNLLEVLGQGDEYTLFLNQEKLASFQDTRLAQGWVGLQVGLDEAGDKGTWIFDNFVLRQP